MYSISQGMYDYFESFFNKREQRLHAKMIKLIKMHEAHSSKSNHSVAASKDHHDHIHLKQGETT